MFTIRSYYKAELALLYCPDSTPQNAMKTLWRWIRNCTDLHDELLAMRYNPKRHTFLRSEVETIIKYLGEP